MENVMCVKLSRLGGMYLDVAGEGINIGDRVEFSLAEVRHFSGPGEAKVSFIRSQLTSPHMIDGDITGFYIGDSLVHNANLSDYLYR